MPHAQHPHQVERRLEAIKRQIAARAMADYELADLRTDTAADPRMIAQHVQRAANPAHTKRRRSGRCLEQKLHYAFEILERRFRVDYPRHRTALGRRAARPFALASR